MKYEPPTARFPKDRTQFTISKHRGYAQVKDPHEHGPVSTLEVDRKRDSDDWWARAMNTRGEVVFDGVITECGEAKPKDILELLAEKAGLI